MIHQMVAKIKKRLKGALQVRSLQQLTPAIQTAFLNAGNSPADFLRLLIAIDLFISKRIEAELARYNLDTRISDQTDRSATIRAYAKVLFEIYCIAAANARQPRLLAIGGQPMLRIAQNVAVDLDQDDGREARRVLAITEGLVLLSLLCGLECDAGRRMVRRLAAGNQRISIRITPKRYASSLVALAMDGQAYCPAPADKRNDQHLQQRLRRDGHGQGSGSIIQVPFFLDLPDGRGSSDINRSEWFTHKSLDDFTSSLLHGSLSFTRDREPFFCPPRLEFTHELIHVLHNARGSNREPWQRQLSAQNQQDWKDAEEYWTITGGDVTENDFNRATGLPSRFGHGGLPLSGLQHGSDYESLTLRRIARNQFD